MREIGDVGAGRKEALLHSGEFGIIGMRRSEYSHFFLTVWPVSQKSGGCHFFAVALSDGYGYTGNGEAVLHAVESGICGKTSRIWRRRKSDS